jgi:hypothetical protein
MILMQWELIVKGIKVTSIVTKLNETLIKIGQALSVTCMEQYDLSYFPAGKFGSVWVATL